MPVIEHEVEIQAAPEAVFALISRVEDFALYSESVEAVTPLGEDRYRWQVRAAGLSLGFEVEVIECTPHERLAWRSVTGVHNRGTYRLTAVEGGTRITLTLEYSLRSRLMEKMVNRAVTPLVRRLSDEIVGRVETRLRMKDEG
ncbi:SRPBCC family protein [Thioalkalivibrio thiocyanodenitrificans]|uniref:SRPBCC family protein n=1 Tax=Thioalkalivibrio thiocyanodenitrificans TaxID=243063 RepID=UPI00036A5439|nr:SRPBCC family protein [Thioalkalivibrio thiocyanodenitrificans]